MFATNSRILFVIGVLAAGVVRAGDAHVVLYDQSSDHPTTTGPMVNSQIVAGHSGFDVQVAEDFAVPAGGWSVSAFNFRMRHASNIELGAYRFNVVVAADQGNEPAVEPACMASSLQPIVTASAGSTTAIDKELTVVLPESCVLPAGTYWVSLISEVSHPRLAFGWAARPGSFGAVARYRNPGNGFLTYCSSWNPVTACGYPLYQMFTQPVAGGYSAFAFQVVGTPITPEPVFVDGFDAPR